MPYFYIKINIFRLWKNKVQQLSMSCHFIHPTFTYRICYMIDNNIIVIYSWSNPTKLTCLYGNLHSTLLKTRQPQKMKGTKMTAKPPYPSISPTIHHTPPGGSLLPSSSLHFLCRSSNCAYFAKYNWAWVYMGKYTYTWLNMIKYKYCQILLNMNIHG